ncbi:DNA primase [Lachnospiraceae bacterium HCP1S3_A8]
MGIQRLTEGNSYGVVCPFCGDTRGKMNFRILKNGMPANTYHCFCCGAKGNMLTLYAQMKGIYGPDRYKIAYREIRDSLRGTVPFRERNQYQKKGAGIPEQEMAGAEAKDAVYRRLLSLLSLKSAHKEELLLRGMREEQIERYQMRSTPVGGTENLARKLIAEGYVLSGIPGFYVNERGNWDVAFFRKNKGFLCPAYSVDGKISGFQVRLDEPYDGRKYLWLSSTNRPKGTGSRSPVTFLGDPFCKTVRVTEGILKAMVSHSLSGYSFLGTPGVNQYKELERTLAVLKRNGLKEVQECYDMDKFLDIRCDGKENGSVCEECRRSGRYLEEGTCLKKEQKRNQIREGCMRLYEACTRLELRCIRKTWDQAQDGTWAGNFKGIDDYWCECRDIRREERKTNGMDGASAV